jgi:hypothetical protein
MKHLIEMELIAYREGETARKEAIAGHLTECPECRAELERIDAVLSALNAMPVPERGEDYGRRVWQQIAPRLPEKPGHWWQLWFEPRRWVAVGAVAALVIAAFIAGRRTVHEGGGSPALSAAQVRERVLVVAVGEHLGRSEMVLMELSNAGPSGSTQQRIDISSEQKRAEELLDENRLYRETAQRQGDAGLASVLDELERVLLDVAHSPQEITPSQLETIRQRMEANGILFKVRVVGKELQEKQNKPKAVPDDAGSKPRERNKA